MSLDIAKFSKINGVEEQDLVNDFLKNKDRILTGLPLNKPLPEHDDVISGDDDFVDISSDSENENEKTEKEERKTTKQTSKRKEKEGRKETAQETIQNHDDDEIEGDDNWDDSE